MRILVTGSREWHDSMTIATAIMDARLVADLAPQEVTIVTGGARGADTIAQVYGSRNGYETEIHLPLWRPYGIYNPQAGLARNTEMVMLGADVCLAFIKDGSAGATDCANKAEAAGIPTRRYYA